MLDIQNLIKIYLYSDLTLIVFGGENGNDTGTTPISSDSIEMPNLVNQIVKMEAATGDELQATVKVEVKTEGKTEDALQEVSSDPLLVGSVKSEVKEENNYFVVPRGISLQGQEGMAARQRALGRLCPARTTSAAPRWVAKSPMCSRPS